MNIIKDKLKNIIKNIIKELYSLDNVDFNIDTPPKKDLWEYCVWFFSISSLLKKSPIVIATEVKEVLEKNIYISDLNISWPYLNINLTFSFYTDIFLKEKLEVITIWKWEKIVVDYIWVNIWKPLHIGHMCTPNQWQVTCNLYTKLWFDVIWDSHLWDWWIIFWKLILAYKKWWNEEKLKENAVDYLLELYIKITKESEENPDIEEETRQEFKKLSLNDKDSILLWQKFTRYSLDAMSIQLKRLNVKPTYDIWESFYEWLNLPKMWDYPDLKYNMKDIVLDLISKKIAIKNEDWSVWVIFDEETKIPSCVLQKRDKTHWYLASDIRAVKYRFDNFKPKKIIYHIDVRQTLHLKQVFEISKKAWYADNIDLIHASNWFISLKTWAMSSRKWNIIKLNVLLDEAILRAKKIILEKNPSLDENTLNEISEIIWIWAIKYWYLSKSRLTDIVFDWDEFMTFEWNSFPYVAYSYVRAKKIVESSNIISGEFWEFYHKSQVNLFKELYNLNEVLLTDYENIMHHNLVLYVYNLSKNFSSFYNDVNILNEEDVKKVNININLIKLYMQVLEIIFEILAIKLPNKM